MLIVKLISGEENEKIYKIDPTKKFTIGRDPAGNITFLDNSVSRYHAEIFKRGNNFLIKDLKSTNGTFINDQKVEEAIIKPGNQIKIGIYTLIFEDVPDVTPVSAKPPASDLHFEDKDNWETTVELKLDEEAEARHGAEILDKEISSPNLNTFYKLSQIITQEKELKSLFNKVLKLVVEVTQADSGYVLVREKNTDKIYPWGSHQQKPGAPRISRTIVKRVIQYVRPLLTSDALLDQRLARSQSVLMANIKSVICVPMVSFSGYDGVMYLESNKLGGSFTQGDLELTTALALQTGMAVITISASEKAKRSLMDTIKILVTSMELKDPKTRGHSERVAVYSTALASELLLSKTEMHHIQLAALLHDVGKIALTTTLPTTRIKQLGKTDAETVHDEHVQMAEKLLSEAAVFPDILPGIKYHHERFDGMGYPYKLKGKDIPLMARIINVANEFDYISAYGGPKGEGLSVKEALAEIDKGRDTLFDEEIVNALFNCHNKGTLFAAATPFDDHLHR